MSQYDLIAFDMDGTLLNTEKQISPDSLEAIHAAALQGKVVALSTGRSLPELQDFLDILPDVRYIIALSGGLVYDRLEDRLLSASPLSHGLLTELLRRLRGIDVMIHLMGMQTYAARDRMCRMAEYNMGAFQPMFDRVVIRVDNLEAFYLADPIPAYKFNLYCRSTAQRAELEQLLSDLPLYTAHSEIASLECSAAGVSKGAGLEMLCRHLGIPLSRSIAVGDSGNDIAMLEAAGLAVAMGNACESVRSAADVIVKDNDHGGCAQAIAAWLMDV